MQIFKFLKKVIYTGLSISTIFKIVKNTIHFCSNEALFEFGVSATKRLFDKDWIQLNFLLGFLHGHKLC